MNIIFVLLGVIIIYGNAENRGIRYCGISKSWTRYKWKQRKELIDNNGIVLGSNNVLPVRFRLSKVHRITLEFKFEKTLLASQWGTFWHIMEEKWINKNSGTCGARIPGIWLHPSGYIRFHHCADDKDFITDAMKWTKNVWDKIEIGQEIRNSEYWIYFKLNGKITHERKNSKPKGNISYSFKFSIYISI